MKIRKNVLIGGEREKINSAIKKLNNSFKDKDARKNKKQINFNALEIEGTLRGDYIYEDLGYVGNIGYFTRELNRSLEHDYLEQPSNSFNPSTFGGHAMKYSFQDKKSKEKRSLIEIHYKSPEDKHLDAWFRGHEETHAIFLCSDPIEYLRKEVKKRYELDIKNIAEKEGQEIVANIGAFLAVYKSGINSDLFIRRYLEGLEEKIRRTSFEDSGRKRMKQKNEERLGEKFSRIYVSNPEELIKTIKILN